MLGESYAVIGMSTSVAAEPGTLEARLRAPPGAGRMICTRSARGIDVTKLATASGSAAYFPLTPASLTDFDALLVMG
jgi:hypothetical protein